MGRIKQLGQVRGQVAIISRYSVSLSFRLQPPPQKRDRHFESASVGIRIDSLRGFWPVILRHPAVSLPEPAIELEGEPRFTKAGFRLYHHNLRNWILNIGGQSPTGFEYLKLGNTAAEF